MKVKKGFKVELLYSVTMETLGSWVASCFDNKGRMIASNQRSMRPKSWAIRDTFFVPRVCWRNRSSTE